MKDQHKHIKGYRDLSESEIALMNRIKALEAAVGGLYQDLLSDPDCDQRWVAIGRTDLQTGFMALVRSVAKPKSDL